MSGPTTMNTGFGPMPYPAPIGPVGGNALLDWIGIGNAFPSFPNPFTAANFLGFGAQNNYSTQNPPPIQLPMGGAVASAPSASGQTPLLPQGMGKAAPSLPNPDIGTFGTGGNAPQGGQFGRPGSGMRPGLPPGFQPGPMNDPRFIGNRGTPMPRMGAGPGSK